MQQAFDILQEKKSAKQLQLDIVSKRIEQLLGGKR